MNNERRELVKITALVLLVCGNLGAFLRALELAAW